MLKENLKLGLWPMQQFNESKRKKKIKFKVKKKVSSDQLKLKPGGLYLKITFPIHGILEKT